MREGRNVGAELRRIVVGAGVRGQEARHERGPRRGAQRTVAIGAVEDDAASRQRLHVGRMGQGMAVDRQERRRHLIGHHDKNIGRFRGHGRVPRWECLSRSRRLGQPPFATSADRNKRTTARYPNRTYSVYRQTATIACGNQKPLLFSRCRRRLDFGADEAETGKAPRC